MTKQWQESLQCADSAILEFDAMEEMRNIMIVMFTHGYSLGHDCSLAFGQAKEIDLLGIHRQSPNQPTQIARQLTF